MSIFIVLLLSLFAILISLLQNYKGKKSSKPNIPPGPPSLPFIGNLHQLDFQIFLHHCLLKLSKKYGPLMLLNAGSVPLLVVSSARLAEEVMKNQDLIFCNRPKRYALQKFSYNHIDIAFAPYSREWREMKKISVVHLLNAKRVQQFSPIIEDEICRMMRKISKDAQQCHITNLSDTISSFSTTFICKIAFGKAFSDESEKKSAYNQIVKDVSELALEGFFFADFLPSIGWLDRLVGMHSRLETVFKKYDEFLDDLIHEHLGSNKPKSMDDDIIDIMLKLQQTTATSFEMTMDHIKAMVMNLFIAGTEPTTSAVTWAMAALIRNPKVMKKLQKEIRGKMGDKEMVYQDDIEKLPYLKASVKEVMRMYPISPLLVPRETLQKCNLNGYEIEAKTCVLVSAWAIGRDPEVWECPDEFRPERFLNSSIDLRGKDFGLIPFGSGRRSCPGTSLGLLTVHLLLANLIRSFDWEIPAGTKMQDINAKCSPTFYKKNAFKLVATVVNSSSTAI